MMTVKITKIIGRQESAFSYPSNFLPSYIVQIAWGSTELGQEDSIFYTHFTKKTGNQPRSLMTL